MREWIVTWYDDFGNLVGSTVVSSETSRGAKWIITQRLMLDGLYWDDIVASPCGWY